MRMEIRLPFVLNSTLFRFCFTCCKSCYCHSALTVQMRTCVFYVAKLIFSRRNSFPPLTGVTNQTALWTLVSFFSVLLWLILLSLYAFDVLMMLVGRQEGHPKKPCSSNPERFSSLTESNFQKKASSTNVFLALVSWWPPTWKT